MRKIEEYESEAKQSREYAIEERKEMEKARECVSETNAYNAMLGATLNRVRDELAEEFRVKTRHADNEKRAMSEYALASAERDSRRTESNARDKETIGLRVRLSTLEQAESHARESSMRNAGIATEARQERAAAERSEKTWHEAAYRMKQKYLEAGHACSARFESMAYTEQSLRDQVDRMSVELASRRENAEARSSGEENVERAIVDTKQMEENVSRARAEVSALRTEALVRNNHYELASAALRAQNDDLEFRAAADARRLAELTRSEIAQASLASLERSGRERAKSRRPGSKPATPTRRCRGSLTVWRVRQRTVWSCSPISRISRTFT